MHSEINVKGSVVFYLERGGAENCGNRYLSYGEIIAKGKVVGMYFVTIAGRKYFNWCF